MSTPDRVLGDDPLDTIRVTLSRQLRAVLYRAGVVDSPDLPLYAAPLPTTTPGADDGGLSGRTAPSARIAPGGSAIYPETVPPGAPLDHQRAGRDARSTTDTLPPDRAGVGNSAQNWMDGDGPAEDAPAQAGGVQDARPARRRTPGPDRRVVPADHERGGALGAAAADGDTKERRTRRQRERRVA